MNNQDVHKVILDINGNDARKELERQQKIIDSIKDSMAKIAESKGVMSDEFKKLESKLVAAQKSLAKYQATCVELSEVLNKLDIANFKDLEKVNGALTNQLKSGAIERGGEKWNELMKQLGPVRQEMINIKNETEAMMANVKNVGDMSVNELGKANRALQNLLSTQQKNTERWKETGQKIQDIQRELDEATAAQKRLIADANGSVYGKTEAELKRMKGALEATLSTQKMSSSEWHETNNQLSAVNKRMQEIQLNAKEMQNMVWKPIDGKSKDELVKMKQVLTEHLNTVKQGSDEWNRYNKRIEQVSAAIDKVELETKKASKYAVMDPKKLPLADLNKMEQTLKYIIKNEKEGTAEWTRANTKLKEVKDQMYQLEIQSKRAAVDVDKVLHNLQSANASELRRTLEVLNKEINSPNIRRGSDEWKRYNEQIKKVNAELKLVESESKETKSWIDRFNDGMNNWQTTIAATVAAIMGLYQQLINMRNFSFEKTDATSKLKAITGLDDKSIFWLRDQAKKLSTEMEENGMRVRQSTAEILDAFRLVGSNKPELLKDREGLYETTKEVLRLAQAANMDLAPSVTYLTTALNQFGQGADAARKYVNALAAGSKYGAADVENQAKVIVRSGVAANLAKLSFEDLVAATETLAETGLKGERAGTSLKTVFTRMELGAKDCRPSIVGLDKALANMASKANDVEWLKKTFGLWSYSAAKTLIDHRESLKKYRKAVTDTNVAVEQAIIMGKNEVAMHTQVINKFKELSDDLYKRVGPAILHVTSKLVNWSRTVKEVIKWIIEHKAELTLLVVQYTALVAVMKMEVIAAKAVVLWNNYIVRGLKMIKTEMKALKASGNIWVIIANLIVSAVTAIALYVNKTKEAALAEKEREEAVKSRIAEEDHQNGLLLQKYRLMEQMLHNEKIAMKDKLKILDELNKAVPEYKGKIDELTGAVNGNVRALDNWMEAQKMQSLQKIYLDEVTKAWQEQREAEEEYNNAVRREHELFPEWYVKRTDPNATFNAANAFSPSPVMRQETEWEQLDKQYQQTLTDMHKAEERKKRADEAVANLEKKVGKLQQEASSKGLLYTFDPNHDTDIANQMNAMDELTKAQIAENVRKAKEDARKEAEKAKLELAQQLDAGLIERSSYEEKLYDLDIKLYDDYIDILKKYYGMESSQYKDMVNDKMKFERQYLENKAKNQEKELKEEEREENKEIRDRLKAIDAETKERIAKATEAKNASLKAGESKEATELEFEKEVFLIEQEAFDKKMALYNEEDTKYKNLYSNKLLHAEEYMNKIQTKTVDLQNKLFAKQSRQYQADIDLLNEALNQKLISQEEYMKAMILLRRKENEALYKDVHAQNATLKLGLGQRVKNLEKSYQEQMAKEKTLLEESKITQEQYEKDVHDMKIQKNKEVYTEYQTALNNWLSKYKVIINQLQNTLSTYTSMVNANYEKQISDVENRYDIEIAAAEKAGKDTTKIEAAKARAVADIKLKQIEAQRNADVAQALINVAMSITEGFAQYGPIVGGVLAALSTAMGAMQIATINTQYEAQKGSLQTTKVLNAGFYEGGYTPGSRYRREAGVVHEGEFVANHEAVNNPVLRPLFDIIDMAQRNNRVGRLSYEDIAMANSYQKGYAKGGYTSPVVKVTAPNVTVPNNNELIDAIRYLNAILDKGIHAGVGITEEDGIERAQKRYQKIIDNKSRTL